MVVLAEVAGRASFLFAEDAVEVRQVVEAAIVAYLRDALGRVDSIRAA